MAWRFGVFPDTLPDMIELRQFADAARAVTP
jgi:hypothetical protein